LTNDLERSIKTIAKGAGVVFIGMVIGHIIGMVNQILLGRFLGAKYYGQFNLAISLVTIAKTLAVFGIPGGITRFIPFYLEKGQMETVKSTISFGIKLVLFVSMSIGIILYLFSDIIAVNVFHEESLRQILKYFFIGIPLVAIPGILESIIRSFKVMKYKLIIYDLGMKLVRVTVFTLFILLGYNLFGAIFAYFVALIFAIIASLFVIQKKLFPFYFKYTKVPIAKKLLSFSWPLSLTGMTFIFVSKTDILLIGYYLTSEEIGIYMPVLVIANLFAFIGISFEYIFLPVISGFFAKEKTDELESIFKSVSKWMFLIASPMLIYTILFPKEIITLLFGSEYSKGYLALIILTLGMFIRVSTGLAGNVLVGGGYTKLNLASEIFSATSNVFLNIILIPIYGIIGAAIGTSVSYTIRSISFLAFTYKTTKIHPYNKDYLKIISVDAVVMGIIFMLKVYLTSFLSWPILMVFLGFFLIFLYAGLLLPTRFLDKNDEFVLEAIERRLDLKLKFVRKFIRL